MGCIACPGNLDTGRGAQQVNTEPSTAGSSYWLDVRPPCPRQEGEEQLWQAPPVAASVPAYEAADLQAVIYNPAATTAPVLLAPGMFSDEEFSRDKNSDASVNSVEQRLCQFEQIDDICDTMW